MPASDAAVLYSAMPTAKTSPGSGAAPGAATVVGASTTAYSSANVGAAVHAEHCAQYPHQVGGHGQLMQLDWTSVLKPLVEREAAFYEAVYAEDVAEDVEWLREFTPGYLGRRELVRGPVETEKEKEFGLGPSVVDNEERGAEEGVVEPLPLVTQNSYDHLRWCEGGDIEASKRNAPPGIRICSDASADDLGKVAGKDETAWDKSLGSVADGRDFCRMSVAKKGDAGGTPLSAARISPWAVHMAVKRPAANAGCSPIIVLEDVNQSFHYPCVADIKVGKRHFDDHATPAKQARHIAKANATTTAATGVRFIGLQSLKGKVYESRDKYHGRRLKVGDLIPETEWFFHNGEFLRKDAIALILKKLRAIAGNMEKQRVFVFYSSSLLIVYEGDTDRPTAVDVRMIDFAHTQRSAGQQLDVGYLSGILYLIGVFEAVLQRKSVSASVPPPVATSIPHMTVGEAPAREVATNGAAAT